MVRTAVIIVCLSILPGLAWGTEGPKQSKPIDRGYGQHDACFGDKYESEDDMTTGNEAEVERLLQLLLNPGS